MKSENEKAGRVSLSPLTYILRSMKRDVKRVRVTLFGISICVVMLIVFLSLSRGMEERMETNEAKEEEIKYVLEGWVTVLAWLISVLLAAIIAHSQIISAYRRRKEIATLIALGIPRKGVMRLISMEGMVITIFSLLVGICIGLVLATINGLLISNSGALGLFLPTSIEISTILYTLAICIGITLLASLVPVIIISRMDPINELRYE